MTETRTTVSETEIKDAISHALLNSLVHQGWHAVRVHTDGEIVISHEPSKCYSMDEYYRRKPHTVTVWESSGATGYMSEDDAQAEIEAIDQDWYDVNVPDLAGQLEPTGLELVDR